jgi:hypothetical protein
METNLLTQNEQSLLDKIKLFFDDMQIGMSAFQIKHFVLNDESFPLPDSKYHQAKLELYTRWQKIVDLEFAFKKNGVQMKLQHAQRMKWQEALHSASSYERLEAEAQIELTELEMEQLRAALMFLQKTCAETFREMRVFLEVVEELKNKLIYESKEAAEAEHWMAVRTLRGERPNLGKVQRELGG